MIHGGLAEPLVMEPFLMTVEQYRELPEREDVIQELHWGRVVELCRPKVGHVKTQSRLVRLLRPLMEQLGAVEMEVPFRAVPEYDIRGVDVAFVSRERWEALDDDSDLQGSPEIVIEVLSPSNTKREMQEKAALYLTTGAQEFWIVDSKRRTIDVLWRSGERATYGVGDRVPLRLFDAALEVALVFE